MKLSPHITLACSLVLIAFSIGYSQSVGINTATPDSSAALDIESTSKGLLIPRMNTAQRTGIGDPADGLLVFDSEAGSFWYFQNSTWQELIAGVFKNENGIVKNTGNHASDDFVFGATMLPPTSQAVDTLLFFDKSKAAFRVGTASSTFWQADSLGLYSFATGRNTRATGDYSSAFGFNTRAVEKSCAAFGILTSATEQSATAFGYETKALNESATAFGNNTKAIGSNSTAMGINSLASGANSLAAGNNTEAIGISSTAFGYFSEANGSYSIAMGLGCYANGDQSFAMGHQSEANGINSAAIGYGAHAIGEGSVSVGEFSKAIGEYSLATSKRTEAAGDYSFASGYYTDAIGDRAVSLGHFTRAGSYASLALGQFNVGLGNDSAWIDSNPVLEIGMGTSIGNRANALTIFKNGNAIAGGHSMPKLNEIVTDHLLMYDNFDGSFRAGKLETSDAWGERGITTFAVGENTVSDGIRSAAFGYNTQSRGDNTTTFGDSTYANGDNAIAMGANATATGYHALAVGLHTTAQAFIDVAIGQYNVGIGESDKWVITDPVFEVGIGISDAIRRNALTVLKNGYTGIGTHLPDRLLDVRGTAQIKLNSSSSSPHLILHEESTSDFARLRFINSNTETHWTIAGKPESDTISSALNFYLQGVGNIMTLHGSDRVGIRETSPESALHIDAKENDNGLRVQLNNSTRFLVLKNGGISMGANNNNVTSSDVYIANQLYFSGINNLPTHRIHLPNDSDNEDGKGLAYEWAVYSDGRVKKNVKPLAYGLADVLALNPVSYNHHSSQFNTNGLQLADEFEFEIGFIAQEVQQVIAEAINQPANENAALWSMDYERLVPVLVKAIQELANDIQELTSDNQELASDNDALHGLLEQQTKKNQQHEMRLTQIETIMAKLIDTGELTIDNVIYVPSN